MPDRREFGWIGYLRAAVATPPPRATLAKFHAFFPCNGKSNDKSSTYTQRASIPRRDLRMHSARGSRQARRLQPASRRHLLRSRQTRDQPETSLGAAVLDSVQPLEATQTQRQPLRARPDPHEAGDGAIGRFLLDGEIGEGVFAY